MVKAASDLLPTLTDHYEVSVINDGSTDSTGNVVAEIAREVPHVRLISNDVNQGYGAALRSGFRHATKDRGFIQMGRAVGCASSLLPLMTADCDVVNGYRSSAAIPFTE